jgi:hypothetical protein
MADSRIEAETIIRWDDDGPNATVYTASPRMARKCAKWGWALAVHSHYQGEPRAWQGEVPKRAIRLAKRATFEKPPSEAQRVARQKGFGGRQPRQVTEFPKGARAKRGQ